MNATSKFSRRVVSINGILVSCLLCLVLSLLSGCGGGLSSDEQAEADKYITEHGKDALVRYLRDVCNDADGNVVLTSGKHLEYCKYLLSKGADINACVRKRVIIPRGDTFILDGPIPLHYAAQYSNSVRLVQFLVFNGADINAICLENVDWWQHDGDINMDGPTPPRLPSKTNTPLRLARDCGNEAVVEYLTRHELLSRKTK